MVIKNHPGYYRYRLWRSLHPLRALRRFWLAGPHGVGVSWTRRVVVRDQAGATPMEGRRPISPVVVFRRNRRRSESSARAAGGRGHGHT